MKASVWLCVLLPIAQFAVIGTFYARNIELKQEVSSLREDVSEADEQQSVGIPPFPHKLPLLAGGEIDLSDEKGIGTFVVVFSPLCPGCEQLAKDWERFGISVGSGGERILGVSTGSEKATKDFIARHQLTFPVALDFDKTFCKHFAVRHTPSFLALDSKGALELRDPSWLVLDRKRRFLDLEAVGASVTLSLVKKIVPSAESVEAISLNSPAKSSWVIQGTNQEPVGFAFQLLKPVNSTRCTDLNVLIVLGNRGEILGVQPLQSHSEYSKITQKLEAVDFVEFGAKFAHKSIQQLIHANPAIFFAECPRLGRVFLFNFNQIQKLFQN